MEDDAPLLGKQESFCREYIVDLNGTQAAIRAGYSPKTANEQASRMLAKVNVQKRIAELKEERNEKVDVNAEYVLKRLYEIDNLDIIDILNDSGDLLPIKQWPEAWRKSVNGIEVIQMKSQDEIIGYLKKVKGLDKVRNLELLGKHVDIGAFKEKIEATGKDGKDLFPTNDLSKLTTEELKQYHALLEKTKI